MSSRGPRRRRSAEDDDGGGLPMVPLFAGVIIAGLGIGALLSALAARHAPAPLHSSSPVVVVHTPTPVAEKVVESPVAQVTAAAPSPQTKATPKRTVPPTATPAAESSPPPTVAPTSKPSEKPSVRPSPARAIAVRTEAPPTARASAPAAAVSSNDGGPAPSLVRRYLEAVAHGDDGTARSALGGGSDADDVQYLDPSLQITSMSSSRKAAGDTEVQVEFRTARGQYFGTFTVDQSGKRIVQHEVIPVGGTTAR